MHQDAYVFDQLAENAPIRKDTPNYFQLIGSRFAIVAHLLNPLSIPHSKGVELLLTIVSLGRFSYFIILSIKCNSSTCNTFVESGIEVPNEVLYGGESFDKSLIGLIFCTINNSISFDKPHRNENEKLNAFLCLDVFCCCRFKLIEQRKKDRRQLLTSRLSCYFRFGLVFGSFPSIFHLIHKQVYKHPRSSEANI